MPLGRISKVHKLLPDQIIQRALDAESPFDAAGRTTLLYPDLMELNAAHAVTISVGFSRSKKVRDAEPPTIWQMHLTHRLQKTRGFDC